jgi:hypothetical protein
MVSGSLSAAEASLGGHGRVIPAPRWAIIVAAGRTDLTGDQTGGTVILTAEEAMNQAPGSMRIAALVGSDLDEVGELEHVRAKLLAGGHGDMPPPTHASSLSGPADVVHAAFMRALATAGERASQVARDHRTLAALRQDNEALRQALGEAEAGLRSHGLLPFRLAFAAEAVEPAPDSAAGPMSMVQKLPVPSTGLAAIALHFSGTPRQVENRRLALHTIEDDRELASWPVPSGARGWTMFALPQAAEGSPRSVRLLLTSEDNVGLPSLSAPMPVPDHCAEVIERESRRGLAAPLALRIWTSIPGTAPPAPPRGGGEIVACQSLPASMLATLTQFGRSRDGARLVWLDEDRAAIHATAPPGTLSGGALTVALPASATMVTADVVFASTGAPAQVALAVGQTVSEAAAVLAGSSNSGARSGWLAVPAAGHARIAIDLEGGPFATRILALGVRSPAGDSAPAVVMFSTFKAWL